VNDILAHKLRERTGKQVRVVPNYPSRSFRARRDPVEVRASLNFSGEGLALFVGNLTDTYDFELIMSSARILPSVEFWIAGPGRKEAQLRSECPKNVKLLGKVPHEDVPDLIGAADVCLAPIRAYQKDIVHNDQDVWKISEYAALGKPIVATNLAPSTQYELVEDYPSEFSRAIERALAGKVRPAVPRFWEDVSEPALMNAYLQL
jgi:glycosyltransferase involved in cell wall biosynthesis